MRAEWMEMIKIILYNIDSDIENNYNYNDDEYILPSFGFDTGRIARSQELSSDEPSSDVAPAYVNYIHF